MLPSFFLSFPPFFIFASFHHQRNVLWNCTVCLCNLVHHHTHCICVSLFQISLTGRIHCNRMVGVLQLTSSLTLCVSCGPNMRLLHVRTRAILTNINYMTSFLKTDTDRKYWLKTSNYNRCLGFGTHVSFVLYVCHPVWSCGRFWAAVLVHYDSFMCIKPLFYKNCSWSCLMLLWGSLKKYLKMVITGVKVRLLFNLPTIQSVNQSMSQSIS